MGEDVPADSELEKNLEKYFKFDQENRGAFLVSATQGESFLDGVIATHFEIDDEEKRSLLLSLIISELSFNYKIRVFSHLMKNYYPEILHKYPNIKNQLEEVIKFRNKMAHRSIDSRTEPVMKYVGKKLSMIFHKDGKIHYELIDKRTFDEKISIAQSVTASLAHIEEEVENLQKTHKNKI